MKQNRGQAVTWVLVVLAVLIVGGGAYFYSKNGLPAPATSNTYTYKNHGFTIELPKGFVPEEHQAEGGPQIVITLPGGALDYYGDASWWEAYVVSSYNFVGDKKIGTTTFKVYTYSGHTIYWFKQGNVGYEFGSNAQDLLKTFKFVGWPSENGDTSLVPETRTLKSGQYGFEIDYRWQYAWT